MVKSGTGGGGVEEVRFKWKVLVYMDREAWVVTAAQMLVTVPLPVYYAVR